MKEQERKQIMEQEELKKECLEYFRARQVYQKYSKHSFFSSSCSMI